MSVSGLGLGELHLLLYTALAYKSGNNALTFWQSVAIGCLSFQDSPVSNSGEREAVEPEVVEHQTI